MDSTNHDGMGFWIEADYRLFKFMIVYIKCMMDSIKQVDYNILDKTKNLVN